MFQNVGLLKWLYFTAPVQCYIRPSFAFHVSSCLIWMQSLVVLMYTFSSVPPQVTSNDKTPTVISSALDKHNQNAQEASKYELIQLLPEGKELIIPPTGNVFYAMSSASVDFLLRRRGGNTPIGSPNLGNETSATFPRIKSKGRRLVRTLF